MDQKDWTYEKIIAAINSGVSRQKDAALSALYKNDKLRNTVRKEIFALGGNEEDFREMLGEAIIKFEKHVLEAHYDPTQSAVLTYIVNLAKSKFRVNQRTEQRIADRHIKADKEEAVSDPEQELNRKEKSTLLAGILESLGSKCQQLLSYVGLGYNNAEIAEQMNYRTTDVVKTEVFMCRKRLNLYLASRNELREALGR